MNAILDFARFLSSGCFVGDLRFILGGFAVVVCVRMFCRGFCAGGGFCLGGLSGGYCPGGRVVWGFCPGGGGIVRGFCPGGFCPRGIVRGVLSGEYLSGGFYPGGGLSRGVLSTGGGGGFVHRWVLSGGFVWGFCPGGGCPGGGGVCVCHRITIKCYPINKYSITVSHLSQDLFDNDNE